jgi:ubiquinone/menaquinone biosynthesis C-methylase UbiE
MEKIRKALAYPPALVNYALEKIVFTCAKPLWSLATRISGTGINPEVKIYNPDRLTEIDEFWSKNTVYAPAIQSALQSRMNIEWRFRIHPMFRELTGLYGNHDNEVVLDYGCGPGNDLTGFAIHSRPKKIIGMDISAKSLSLASHRLALHKIDPGQIELIQLHDADSVVPLPDSSVDFISCQGVLMHTSEPLQILAEFFRVLKPGSKACIMVYSQPSIWFHLYTAYEKMIVRNAFPGMTVEQAFTGNTDGLDCPMSRCFPVNDFIAMCRGVGFECHYAGGYLTETEMISLRRYLKPALDDPRLGQIHKEFLRALNFDKRGWPTFQGSYAGVSGVYHLKKTIEAG